jgi:tRNA pseudouridine13 synthase
MYKIKQKPEDFFVREISNVKIEEDGNYSYFLLKKRSYTTLRALQHIAKYLNIPLRNIGFAGSKDKNAVTEQVVSVKNVGKERLEKIKLKDIEIKFIGKGKKPVCLGDLEGNYFKIIVRDAEKEPEKLEKFRNLFGEQRFSAKNKDIGKAIIKKDFKKAVELVMETDVDEKNVLNESLQKNPNDFVGALKKVPIKKLKMYVHAYQSFLWNMLAEESKDDELEIIGFATAQTPKIKQILKEESITTRDFIIKEIPELSSEGGVRKVFAEIKDLKVRKIGKKTFEFEFKLSKGSYATEFISQSFQEP